jgi:hypothetical protein
MLPANYEYQSDFARKYYGQGKSEGRTEGSRDTLIKLLSLRFGPLAETALSRIVAASSAELEEIAERFLTAATLDEALGAPGNRSEVNAQG